MGDNVVSYREFEDRLQRLEDVVDLCRRVGMPVLDSVEVFLPQVLNGVVTILLRKFIVLQAAHVSGSLTDFGTPVR